jgi:ubiquinone/menaquinone biosynthesis C-methylase UbiE
MVEPAKDLGIRSHVDAALATLGSVTALRVLDIGCGEGRMTRALAERGADVTGYDPFIAETPPARLGAGRFRLARAPADAIPEGDHTADIVLFVFSLHHVPQDRLERAIAEARRVLKPGGRLYVAEPLAQGPFQYVMELFHDETAVRRTAADALARFARPGFARVETATYTERRTFPAFDDFAERMIANMRFNGYSKEAVLAPEVRQRFAEMLARHGGNLDQPVRIDCFGPAA